MKVNIRQTTEIRDLTKIMIDIAVKGAQTSDSEHLNVIYGLILDCAYKIRQTMDKEAEEISKTFL